MARTLFTNATIWPGSGEGAFAGALLVEGNRIAQVWHGAARDVTADETIDCRGGTLMPGLVDGHSHLSFVETPVFADMGNIPPEEHLLATMHHAKRVLEAGFTSAVGAGSAKARLDIVIRNEIHAGRIPGPRMLAASPELTVTGGLGDERKLHLYRESVGMIVDGADEMRRAVRTLCREGVDIVKLNVSGNQTLPNARAETTLMTEAEVDAACDTAQSIGKRVAAHCRSSAAVQLALRHGVSMIYHCEFADAQTLDLLEAARDRVFLAPAVGLLHALIYEAEPWGITRAKSAAMGVVAQYELVTAVYTELRKRKMRVLIGGDYGFPWTPHGTNARDLEHFVNLFGYSAHEALLAATAVGAQAMLLGDRCGQLRDGFLADLILVDGKPHDDVRVLQQQAKLRAVMKDGNFYKRLSSP
ncbi:MAG: amidohydrolase family protein [Burkholderiales bacterium]